MRLAPLHLLPPPIHRTPRRARALRAATALADTLPLAAAAPTPQPSPAPSPQRHRPRACDGLGGHPPQALAAASPSPSHAPPAPPPSAQGPRAARARHLLLGALILLGPAACRPAATAPPCAHPPQLALVAAAGGHLNLGPDGAPWPTHLRIYQLPAAPSAPLDLSALRKGDDALGPSPLVRDDRVLYPDEEARWLLPRDPAATHAVVAAFYRRPAGDSWIAVVPLPAAEACLREPPCVRLRLDRYSLDAAPAPAGTPFDHDLACAAWPPPSASPAAPPRARVRKAPTPTHAPADLPAPRPRP